MSEGLILLVAAVAGWVITSVLVPLLARICHRRGWLDQPGPRKAHPHPTPRLTGVALFFSIWVPLLAAVWFAPTHVAEFLPSAIPIITGAILILGVGVIDDFHPLSGAVKLTAQATVGTFLYAVGIGFDRLWIPFVGGVGLGILSWPVTLLWFLILVNSINIIDGMDGLAVSTTAVATLTLIWVSWIHHLPATALGSAALFGGLVAFWRFNRPPARVFMGDSGSLTLGYFIAVVALLVPIKRFTVVAFFVPVFALLLPLAEAAMTLGRRSLSGTNPLGADAGHIHHRLLEHGFSARRILIVYNVLAVILGTFCVGLRYANRRVLAAVLGFFVLSILVALGIILRPRTLGSTGHRHGVGDED
ncbi:MAG: MraY family glycosyltransferase [Candidatus Zixiibacteriota bacterium]